MLKIKNGDIFLNRGESASLRFNIWKNDGSPFIMPKIPGDICLRALCNISGNRMYSYNFHQPLLITDSDGITIRCKSDGATIVTMIDANDEQTSERFNSSPITITYVNYKIVSIVTENKIIDITYNRTGKVIADVVIELPTVVFTVKAGKYDDIVLCKVLNMCSYMSQDGETDYTLGGWSKFSGKIVEASNINDLESIMSADYNLGIVHLGKVGNNYYHLVRKKNNDIVLKPYSFDIVIPLDSEDTLNLEPKEYTYDLIAYQGFVDPTTFNKNIPLYMDIQWKKELIIPHKFTIGDSNNA